MTYKISNMVEDFCKLTKIDFSECYNRARKLRECGFLPSGRVGGDAVPISLNDMAIYFLSFGSSSIAKSPEAVLRLSQLAPEDDRKLNFSKLHLSWVSGSLLETLLNFLIMERHTKLKRIEISKISPIGFLVFRDAKGAEYHLKFTGCVQEPNDYEPCDIRFSIPYSILSEMSSLYLLKQEVSA